MEYRYGTQNYPVEPGTRCSPRGTSGPARLPIRFLPVTGFSGAGGWPRRAARPQPEPGPDPRPPPGVGRAR